MEEPATEAATALARSPPFTKFSTSTSTSDATATLLFGHIRCCSRSTRTTAALGIAALARSAQRLRLPTHVATQPAQGRHQGLSSAAPSVCQLTRKAGRCAASLAPPSPFGPSFLPAGCIWRLEDAAGCPAVQRGKWPLNPPCPTGVWPGRHGGECASQNCHQCHGAIWCMAPEGESFSRNVLSTTSTSRGRLRYRCYMDDTTRSLLRL